MHADEFLRQGKRPSLHKNQVRKNEDVKRSHYFSFKIKLAFEPHGKKTHLLTTWINYFVEQKNTMRKLLLALKYKNTIARYI